MTSDPRLYAPSVARNREPVLAAIQPLLPPRGVVLEIASGSGEHITALAALSGPDLVFQPSDPDPAARASVDAWAGVLGLGNVRPAIAIDAAATEWPLTAADFVMSINMIHISPWTATLGLFAGAARILPKGGVLYTYGPYRRDGRHTSDGNASFDADLRASNPDWGIRDVEALRDTARDAGFGTPRIIDMPANNLSLIFERAS